MKRQGKARLINQMMKDDSKLFHKSSHRLSCQFDLAELFVTQEQGLPFAPSQGLRILHCCAVHIFQFRFAYLIMCSHKFGK